MHADRGSRSQAGPSADHPEDRGSWDLGLSVALAVAGTLGALWLPAGDTVRLLLALPVVLLVPGYLLLQALMVPTSQGFPRWLEVLFSIALSPAIVGLVALATWVIPGGFQPRVIIGTVTGACFLLAAVALQRRGSPGDRSEPGTGGLERPDDRRDRG